MLPRVARRMVGGVGQAIILYQGRFSATYSRMSHDLFGSVFTNLDAGRTRMRTTGRCAVSGSACRLLAVDTDAQRASFPSNDQLNAPATIVIGSTAYDYQTAQTWPGWRLGVDGIGRCRLRSDGRLRGHVRLAPPPGPSASGHKRRN